MILPKYLLFFALLAAVSEAEITLPDCIVSSDSYHVEYRDDGSIIRKGLFGESGMFQLTEVSHQLVDDEFVTDEAGSRILNGFFDTVLEGYYSSMADKIATGVVRIIEHLDHVEINGFDLFLGSIRVVNFDSPQSPPMYSDYGFFIDDDTTYTFQAGYIYGSGNCGINVKDMLIEAFGGSAENE